MTPNPLKLVVLREKRDPEYTMGRLFVDGQFYCYTMEDAVREKPGVPVEDWKIEGVSAIPYGTYSVIVNQSPRFGRPMPLLLQVPGFKGIRMHGGNDAGDTEGCIIVAANRDLATGRVWSSVEPQLTKMLKAMMKDGRTVTCEVRNA